MPAKKAKAKAALKKTADAAAAAGGAPPPSPLAAPTGYNATLLGRMQEMINDILNHVAFSGVQNEGALALGSGGSQAPRRSTEVK